MTARSRILASLVAAAVVIVVIPELVSDFVLLQIAIKSLWLGIAGASLTFLIGQAGLISLAQTAVFGVSGYVMAILVLDHGWGVWFAVAVAAAAGPITGLIVGVISRRAAGLYLMMLTLAIGVFVFFFAQQYQPITRGHTGFNGFDAPMLFGADLNDRRPLFYVTAVAAVAVVAGFRYVMATPAGLAYRGLRDNPKRLQALGYSTEATTVSAFAVSGVAAGAGGVISVWYNGAISPGSIDLTRTIELLIVVMIGGTLRIEGAFLGALAVMLLRNYASDLTNRTETLVGAVFMVVVLVSRQGLTGILLGLGSRVQRALGLVQGRDPTLDRPVTDDSRLSPEHASRTGQHASSQQQARRLSCETLERDGRGEYSPPWLR